MSTRLLIGLIPQAAKRLCIHLGDGPIFTFLTTFAQYLEHKSESLTSTLIYSLTSPSVPTA